MIVQIRIPFLGDQKTHIRLRDVRQWWNRLDVPILIVVVTVFMSIVGLLRVMVRLLGLDSLDAGSTIPYKVSQV